MMLSRRDWQSLRYLFQTFLAPSWKKIIVIVLANTMYGVILSVRPVILAPAVDTFAEVRAAPATSIKDLTLNNIGPTILNAFDVDYKDIMQIGMIVVGMFIGLTFVLISLGIFGQILLIQLKSKLMHDMTIVVHRHLILLPLGYFQQQKTGDLVSRITLDVKKTADALDNIARGLLISIAQVAVSVVILFRTDAILAASVVGLGFIHLGITRILQKRIRSGAKEQAERVGAVGSNLVESFVGIRVIKSFAAEQYESQKLRFSVAKYRDSLNRFGRISYYEIPARMLADAIVVAVVILIVFDGVMNNRLTLAGAAMFLYISQQLSAPLGNFFSQLLGLYNLLGGGERLFEIINTKSSMTDGNCKVPELKKGISVNHVTFGYQSNKPVLRDITLTIKRGEMVALVGPSGAGKSTLVDLILRLYDVGEGDIKYDGIDIKAFSQEKYRRKFGVVAQECLLFNDSVRENIILNREEDKDDLAHAIWAANAEEFIQALPEGLDTVVGDRGIKLSGGQRQRIAIARAIYSYPSILILDEATSALDSVSERAVQEAIDRVSKEITTIVIAHRLSTIFHADEIILLNQGRVEAIGPHARLLQISPTYRRLYELQFQESPERVAEK